jgi:hypothetical protein
MDSLRNLYSDKGYNFKVTFNEYLKAKGYNYQKVWTDIVSAIRQVRQLQGCGQVFSDTRQTGE